MSSTFTPKIALISDISNAQNAVITFTDDHTFVDNEIISLRVTKSYGMVEANEKHVKVLSHDATTVTVDMDSLNYTAFSIPGDLSGTTPPCAVPATSGIDFSLYAPTMILDDAFDNRPD